MSLISRTVVTSVRSAVQKHTKRSDLLLIKRFKQKFDFSSEDPSSEMAKSFRSKFRICALQFRQENIVVCTRLYVGWCEHVYKFFTKLAWGFVSAHSTETGKKIYQI